MTLAAQLLTLQPASASFGGVVTTGAQTFAGAKTFNSVIVADLTGDVTGNVTGNVTGDVTGGTAASDNLTLNSTSHGTKGFVLLNPTTGYVGIGTATPKAKLEVFGEMQLPTIPNLATASSGILRIRGNGSDVFDIGISPAGGGFTRWLQAGYGGSGTEPIALNPLGGNVGVGTGGTAAPGAKLEVVSSAANSLRLKKTAGTAGSVDMFSAVGDATSRTGTALCATIAANSVCLGSWGSGGANYVCGVTSVTNGRALCADFGD